MPVVYYPIMGQNGRMAYKMIFAVLLLFTLRLRVQGLMAK